MNKEEIDKWLDNEYGMSYTKLEELHDYFFEKYTNQKEEIERLKEELSVLVKDDEEMQLTIIKQNERIIKAIEYIEEMNVWCIEFENYGVESKDLVKILKGE